MSRGGVASSSMYALFAACMCGGMGRSVQAAQWSFAPIARVTADAAENPRFLNQGGESTSGVVSELEARLSRTTKRLDMALTPVLRFARYNDAEGVDAGLNSHNQSVALQIARHSELFSWAGNATLTRDSTLTSELGSTGLTQTNRRHENLALGGGPTLQLTERVSIGGQASWTDNRYADAQRTGLVDYRYGAASIFGAYALSERTKLSLNAQAGRLEVPSQGMSTGDTAVSLRLQRDFGLRWTASVSGGPSQVESNIGREHGAVYAADLSRRSELLTLSASVRRSLTPTGRGLQTLRDELVIDANRTLTQRLSAAVSVRFSRNQDLLPAFGVAFGEVRYRSIEGRLAWQLSPECSTVFALNSADQDSPFSPERAQGHHFLLSFVWNGQPRTTSR